MDEKDCLFCATLCKKVKLKDFVLDKLSTEINTERLVMEQLFIAAIT